MACEQPATGFLDEVALPHTRFAFDQYRAARTGGDASEGAGESGELRVSTDQRAECDRRRADWAADQQGDGHRLDVALHGDPLELLEHQPPARRRRTSVVTRIVPGLALAISRAARFTASPSTP